MSAETTWYLLRFTEPLHLGDGRPGEYGVTSILPRSDTISAALVSLWGEASGSEGPESIAQAPPFVVSSGLPARRDRAGKWRVAFPILKGGCSTAGPDGAPGSPEKERRKVRYVEAGVHPGCGPLPGGVLDGEVVWAPGIHSAGADPEPFASVDDRVRVSIDRASGRALEGVVFSFGAVTFSDDSRVALCARFEDGKARKMFESAVSLLGECGLGGDRSSGYGRFEWEHFPGKPEYPAPGSWSLALGLWHPTAEELRHLVSEARYEVVLRDGWVTAMGGTPIRRPGVRMISEGALVPGPANGPVGDCVRVLDPVPDIGLNHPVYRDGRALMVPCRGPEPRP